jgi:prepilin-type N-terminal cleavage/methylation domain-containing protein
MINRLKYGFTLIELLVVIAIIGILAAILFPVFSTMLENSRQSNTMSKLQQIQSALALYKLDNKTYPSVLFAYANTGGSDTCNANMANISASSSTCSSDLVGLYPSYIKDWHVFLSPDNIVTDPAATVSVNVNYFPTGTTTLGSSMASKSVKFFSEDAFDSGPQITGVNQVSSSTYVARYQTSWTDYTPTPASIASGNTADSTCFPGGQASSATGICTSSDPDYVRQLRWTLPPPNTYVTATTAHVNSANKVLVLFLDGSVKKFSVLSGFATAPTDLSAYATYETQFNDGLKSGCSAPGVVAQVPYSGTNVNMSCSAFWRVTPNLTALTPSN